MASRQPSFRCIDRDAYPFIRTTHNRPTRTMEITSLEIPDEDPAEWGEEKIQEMGVQQSFFVLGQIRAHELAMEINMDQLLAAVGVPAAKEHLDDIIHEVRGKVIRTEQQTREDSAFGDLIMGANIDDIGPAVFAYSNGFHAALGQLAKMVATIHIVENDPSASG